MKSLQILNRAVLASALFSLPASGFAASASWTGSGTTSNYSEGANWSTGTVPGNTSGSFSADVATFNNATKTNISVDTRGIGSIVFDTANAGAFTFRNGQFYTTAVTLNSTVVNSQTFYSNISGANNTGDLIFKNDSATAGVVLNLRGNLTASTALAGAVNFQGKGSGIIAWGNINDSGSVVTSLKALDSNANVVMLKGSSSNFSGQVTATAGKGAIYFASVKNVGGGASSLGAPTTAANGKLSLGGFNGGNPVSLYYIGSGSVTDRAIELSSGSTASNGIELWNLGTGSLVWNGAFTSLSNLAAKVSLGGISTAENRYGGAIADGSLATSVTKVGQATWNLSAANTYTGATSIGEGTLRTDFSAAGAPTSNIISSSSALTMSGGTFAARGAASGTSAQTMNGVTLNAGGSTLSADGNGGAGTTLTVGAITRNTGAALNVQTASTGAVATSTTTTTNNVLTNAASGGVAYATVNGSDWATVSGGNIVALSSYQTSSNPTSWAATDNVSVSGNPSASIGTQTINTLKVNGASSVSIQATKTLTLGAGGLLFTGSGAQSISGGSLTSGTTSKELVIRQNNTGSTVDISSAITATTLTKTGAGTLSLSGTNTYSGSTYITEGVLKGGSGTNIPVNANAIYLAGGVLGLTSDFNATLGVSGGAAARVAWTNSGGFAAYGANRTVTVTDRLIPLSNGALPPESSFRMVRL